MDGEEAPADVGLQQFSPHALSEDSSVSSDVESLPVHADVSNPESFPVSESMSNVDVTGSPSAVSSSSSSVAAVRDEAAPGTPQKGMAVSRTGSTSGLVTTPPRTLLSRFPLRVGITWKKGEKLEAMDYSRTWYPSKIVDLDEKDQLVLIHFEGWNHRYDEWLPMGSDKLRPVTRHSERKDRGIKKRRAYPHPVSDPPAIYRAGERVLAKWTDCKKYPAKVNRLMDDGSYEVIFYDGISRLIQPINIQPLPEGMGETAAPQRSPQKVAAPAAAQPKVSSGFKNIALKLPESVTQKLSRPSVLTKKKFPPTKGFPQPRFSPVKSEVAGQEPSTGQLASEVAPSVSEEESSSQARGKRASSQGEEVHSWAVRYVPICFVFHSMISSVSCSNMLRPKC
ncbi:PHD finger protein 20-like protein 1 isoform X1 [Aplysia californica]|uniref:PHD finger protein 20-like protein 1 isoform X1 n=2 Tax=Aplysia californica TaxID=6500 RepID=A0ABM0ZWN8_APLCA|nr:PHD finger protein 20-like protein 1 isoform X1 [Aplysia californica]